jgi:ketosteroid isomerase-like protein
MTTQTKLVRLRQLIAISLCCSVLLAGCSGKSTATPSHAEDEAAIAEFNRQYLKAINDGDIKALSSLTTEDHIMIAPNRQPIVGKAANDAANGRAFEQVDIDETWSPLETVISGDLAYQRGTFTVTATAKSGGTPRNLSGHFLRIYRRQPDGSWRMTRDMFNSDNPAAQPPAE